MDDFEDDDDDWGDFDSFSSAKPIDRDDVKNKMNEADDGGDEDWGDFPAFETSSAEIVKEKAEPQNETKERVIGVEKRDEKSTSLPHSDELERMEACVRSAYVSSGNADKIEDKLPEVMSRLKNGQITFDALDGIFKAKYGVSLVELMNAGGEAVSSINSHSESTNDTAGNEEEQEDEEEWGDFGGGDDDDTSTPALEASKEEEEPEPLLNHSADANDVLEVDSAAHPIKAHEPATQSSITVPTLTELHEEHPHSICTHSPARSFEKSGLSRNVADARFSAEKVKAPTDASPSDTSRAPALSHTDAHDPDSMTSHMSVAEASLPDVSTVESLHEAHPHSMKRHAPSTSAGATKKVDAEPKIRKNSVSNDCAEDRSTKDEKVADCEDDIAHERLEENECNVDLAVAGHVVSASNVPLTDIPALEEVHDEHPHKIERHKPSIVSTRSAPHLAREDDDDDDTNDDGISNSSELDTKSRSESHSSDSVRPVEDDNDGALANDAADEEWGDFGGGEDDASPTTKKDGTDEAKVSVPAAAADKDDDEDEEEEWGDFGGGDENSSKELGADGTTTVSKPASPKDIGDEDENEDWGDFDAGNSSVAEIGVSAADTQTRKDDEDEEKKKNDDDDDDDDDWGNFDAPDAGTSAEVTEEDPARHSSEEKAKNDDEGEEWAAEFGSFEDRDVSENAHAMEGEATKKTSNTGDWASFEDSSAIADRRTATLPPPDDEPTHVRQIRIEAQRVFSSAFGEKTSPPIAKSSESTLSELIESSTLRVDRVCSIRCREKDAKGDEEVEDNSLEVFRQTKISAAFESILNARARSVRSKMRYKKFAAHASSPNPMMKKTKTRSAPPPVPTAHATSGEDVTSGTDGTDDDAFSGFSAPTTDVVESEEEAKKTSEAEADPWGDLFGLTSSGTTASSRDTSSNTPNDAISGDVFAGFDDLFSPEASAKSEMGAEKSVVRSFLQSLPDKYNFMLEPVDILRLPDLKVN